MPGVQLMSGVTPPSGVNFGLTHDDQALSFDNSGCLPSHDVVVEARRARLQGLRAEIQALEAGPGDGRVRRVLPLGVAALDRHLPGGGLPLAGLHEIEGERAEWDDGAATGFCLALLARLLATETRGAVLWVSRWRDLYAPGLAAFGLDPRRLILVHADSEADVLWALEEGLRCGDLAAVVGEADDLDRAAGRRLQLATEVGGRPALVLRRRLRPAGRGIDTGAPSGALSRWRIGPLRAERVVCPDGAPLHGPVARLPGQARWMAELRRCRGTGPGQWDLEWDDAAGGFAVAATVCDRPLVAGTLPGDVRRAS